MNFSSENRSQLESGIERLGVDCNVEQVDTLCQYGELILKWNRVYNLTALRQPEDVVTHHLLDSLAAVPLVQKSLPSTDARLLDVGSGAGLPGLVFAICCPELQVTTLDTVQKKVAFMQQAIAALGLKHAKAVQARIESFHVEQPFDLISSRAFSSLENFIQWSQHLLADSGRFLALKGKLETDQQVPSGWQIEATHGLEVPYLPEARHLFVITR